MSVDDVFEKESNPIFARSEMLLGEEGIRALRCATVAVFGIGGVGSYTVEALARSGVGGLILVDGDDVCVSNINRQLIATLDTVGQNKAVVAKERALSINPDIKVDVYSSFYTAENFNEFDLSCVDYIVDAIDMVSSKILLIENAKKLKIPVISCMGAGNKLDPTLFRVADISKTSVCPLAKVMRVELRKRNITNVKTVFSTEEAITPTNERSSGESLSLLKKRQTPGSVAFVPSVAGLIIAGVVIKDIALKN